jgi:hypothetical protein
MPYRTLNEALETVTPTNSVPNILSTSSNNFNFSHSLCTCNTETANTTNKIAYSNQSTFKIVTDNRRLSSINDEQLNNIQSII